MNKRIRFLILALAFSGAPLFAVTYTQPFNVGHGFTPAPSGACDNTYTDNAADSTNGNPVNSVNSLCNGRNDNPTTTWKKSFASWEVLAGITPGNNVTLVDGKFDHQRTTQTHAQVATVGPLQIMNSGETASCMDSDPEAVFSYPNTTGTISWATHDATGAVGVAAGCQASNTPVVVRFGINPRTGNNGSAQTQVNVDNLVLVITEVTPSGRSRVVMITFRQDRSFIRHYGGWEKPQRLCGETLRSAFRLMTARKPSSNSTKAEFILPRTRTRHRWPLRSKVRGHFARHPYT